MVDEVGVENWNELGDDYAFLYTHPANSKKVLVKCLAMNDKLLVDALSEDSSEPIHLEIKLGFPPSLVACNLIGYF